MLGAGETVIGQTNKLGADANARGLYRLTGDGSGVEKRDRFRPSRIERGLDRTAVLMRHMCAWTWTSSSAHRPTSTSGSCRSR